MSGEWDDDYDEEDWPDDDDSVILIRCPHCDADVYEEAEQCPACGEYIVHGTRIWDGKPLWWAVLGLAGIIAVVWMLTGL